MRIWPYIVLLFMVFFSAYPAAAGEEMPVVLVGAEEGNDWPPFEYFVREQGKKTDRMAGLSIEILNEIFGSSGIRYQLRFYPWKRCLKYLREGENVHMALPASLNEERLSAYLVSRRVYTITPAYFYFKERYPRGLSVNRSLDLLDQGQVCGRLGYNYVNFGIPNHAVYRGPIAYHGLIEMTKNGRCDIFLARYEVLAAHSLIGQDLLGDQLASAPVPGVEPESFHFLISRKYRHGTKLLRMIDDGLERLERSGDMKRLRSAYPMLLECCAENDPDQGLSEGPAGGQTQTFK